MSDKMYTRLRDTLRDYVEPGELDAVTGWVYWEMANHIMKHRMKRGGFWWFIGFMMGILSLLWLG